MSAFETSARPVGFTLGGALEVEGTHASWAAFSPDRCYRYALGREWNEDRPTFVAVCLNPSTADATADDPTVRRLLGFARREKCGSLILVNAFAWRSTDPRALLNVKDPVGPHNDEAITVACCGPLMAVVVAAWGASFPRLFHDRLRTMLAWPRRGRWQCFGVTASGHPRHPLYVPKTAPIVDIARGVR